MEFMFTYIVNIYVANPGIDASSFRLKRSGMEKSLHFNWRLL